MGGNRGANRLAIRNRQRAWHQLSNAQQRAAVIAANVAALQTLEQRHSLKAVDAVSSLRAKHTVDCPGSEDVRQRKKAKTSNDQAVPSRVQPLGTHLPPPTAPTVPHLPTNIESDTTTFGNAFVLQADGHNDVQVRDKPGGSTRRNGNSKNRKESNPERHKLWNGTRVQVMNTVSANDVQSCRIKYKFNNDIIEGYVLARNIVRGDWAAYNQMRETIRQSNPDCQEAETSIPDKGIWSTESNYRWRSLDTLITSTSLDRCALHHEAGLLPIKYSCP
jgi:hypothetical protein